MKRKIVIIGSGLGGLVTGYLLSKQGDQVSILEHAQHPGGCMQSFYRDGIRFDTGFHYVGGLAEEGPLYRFFRDLNLLSLPWKPLKEQQIWVDNQCFVLPVGEQKWLNYLVEKFPHQEQNLINFLNVCREVAFCPTSSTKPYWEQNAWEWLYATIDDALLRDVLSGCSLLVELNRKSLPLFAFAEINYSFIHSSHRLIEGGELIINHLVDYIKSCGGELHYSSTVTKIVEQNGKVVGVELQDGSTIDADIVVSSVHPAETMNLLSENTSMRKIYQQRIGKLKNSFGFFCVNIKLKDDTLKMQDTPIYVHRKDSDLWDIDATHVNHILIHPYAEQNALDLLCPLSWDMVHQWEGTSVGHRGEDYEKFKESVVEQCIDLAETAIPKLRDAIEKYWSSTPLTWQNYLLSHNGTAYGISKDCNSPESTLLLPRTPLQGLYLTGQSMILHGIMGTTISGFLTTEFLKQ